MTLNNQKEQFSAAYARAIASVANLKVSKCEIDDDSIDITLERTGGLAERLDIQLKCTAAPIPKSGDLSYPLKVKNYRDLSRTAIMPRILVVLYVPTAPNDWLDIQLKGVFLKYCAWWLDLRNAPETDNTDSITVTLPRVNLFSPEVANDLLDELGKNFIPA